MLPWRGWGAVVVLPVAVLLLSPPQWPRWLFMWMLAFALFLGCKWLTWRRTQVTGIPWWLHLGYLIAWPGMDAREFLSKEYPLANCQPRMREWGAAGSNVLLGAALFWVLSRLIPSGQEMFLGWCGMIGLILMLHFGTFHLLSCAWRAMGVNARPLMNRPLASERVSEFWGKRWNTAFRDLTYRFLFRPLTIKLGLRRATVVGFAVSGLVHELVISVPAHGGYGGPTLFFCIQAVALLVERSAHGRSIGLGHGWRGKLYTLLVLILPAYGLFSPPFVRNIIVPFMRTLGVA